jgi:hypothetical protein
VQAPNPVFDYVPDGTTLREVRRRDGRTLRVLHDADGDGSYERQDLLGPDGRVLTTAEDFVDGIFGRLVESRAGDLTVTWADADRDGVFDSARVTGRDGALVQTIEWQPQRGFVVKAP